MFVVRGGSIGVIIGMVFGLADNYKLVDTLFTLFMNFFWPAIIFHNDMSGSLPVYVHIIFNSE